MFKPSQPMMARLRLTTKQVNGGYYKGNRTGSMGKFAKHGRYVIDWKKVRTYVVPEGLESFKLTPFVTKRAEPKRNIYFKEIEQNGRTRTVMSGLRGADFLDIWSERNAREVIEEQKKTRNESGKQETKEVQERV